MRRWVVAAVALGVVAGFAGGCRKSAPLAVESGPKPVPRSLNALDPATMGTVSGVVRFAGSAPAPVRLDTSADPACGEAFSEQIVAHDGKLANVYVYVKSGPAAAMAMGETWMAPVVLDAQNCRFVPHVMAVTAGQRVEFRNDDAVVHDVRAAPAVAGNAAVDLVEAKGASQMRFFRKPEGMMPVRCARHPWMSAFLNVSPTPFFAVTGADGTFALKGLPAGKYTLGFVQEKMGERTFEVVVKAQSEATVEMTYSL